MKETASEPSGYSIRLEHVEKHYQDNERLTIGVQNVNLNVSSGTFVALVGHTGCGKTTLLNLIAGLTRPSSGAIYVNDQIVTAPSDRCGMVFQEYSLFPWRTLRENVEYPLEIRHWHEEAMREKARQYVRMVGLENASELLPKALSGGMKQRAAIARALVYEPDILLLDEPFSALDVATRKALQLLLLEIWQKSRKTILFVTHDVKEACLLAEKIVVMTSPENSIRAVYEVGLEHPRLLDSTRLREIEDEITASLGLKTAFSKKQN